MVNYKPNKRLSTKLNMSIILKDDILVCQRSRRLALIERQKVEEQVKDWLEQSIIQESCSDYAPPIVLVKKKMAL